ncbi:hypothetical protein GOBAR_DD28656 [Gossypium barbadense]|nr:hypothetical protein GOBAR_DD28656 [Gossypium barbadense]
MHFLSPQPSFTICTLPDGLRNLISFKHLHFDKQEHQPAMIGNLTCLQTLPIFFVGSKKGHRVKELGSLNELSGELRISNLEDVIDKQDANRANMHCKDKLCKVIFEWSWGNDNDKEVMEGLQPHTNLQTFPSWMFRPVGNSNTGLLLLDNLIELEFINCINCESLPPLGQLHNLQFLKLENLTNVKHVGNGFYYSESTDGMNEVIRVFPALKEFTLEGMESLEEWIAMKATNATMFPRLERLDISGCPWLKSAPLTGQCSSLEKQSIFECEILSKIRNGLKE